MRQIELTDMLPRVFVKEGVPHSQVWLTSCVFQRGRHYLVEAPSGGGKSSLMAYIYGSRTDYQGTLRFNSRDTSTLSMEQWQKIRRRHLAYLPQELDLFPELTCIENIRLKNNLTQHVNSRQIDEWLERLGIASRRDTPAGRMSIGQQQRLALIRALCQPFDFILLDEPVSHLDSANNLTAAQIISEEATRQGAGVISTSVGNPLLLHSATNIKL
ncbi:MAG: ATP-binding cassette domain-containing protein [Bacteroides sp.]|nr:ATP-binding cassette domain-containing protein [Bacteroides sp.]